MIYASDDTSVLRRKIHHPTVVNAPPISGPSARQTGLLAVTSASKQTQGGGIRQVLNEAQDECWRRTDDPGQHSDDNQKS